MTCVTYWTECTGCNWSSHGKLDGVVDECPECNAEVTVSQDWDEQFDHAVED